MSEYNGHCAVQIGITPGGQVPAQILVSTDCAGMFPVSVCHPDGILVQTKNCRLKQSLVNGRYLLFFSGKRGDELVKKEFPVDGTSSLETYLLNEDTEDFEFLHIAPLPMSSIVEL